MPAFSDAFVYAFPQRILPCSSETQAEKDYTVRRSHIARLPPLALDPEVTNRVSRLPYCVLSSEPYRGRSTISVARTRIGNINDSRPYSVEITFWPRPSPGSRSSFASDTEYEEAESKKLLPACTIAIPGSIRSRPGVWELIVMANSGLAVIMVVDPPYELPPIIIEDDTEGTEPTEEAPPPPPPQLMLVRFDPLLGSATLHELVLEGATGEDTIDVKNICGVAIDDHRGVAIVVTDDQVLHYIPYA
ncbi:hypothetical protein B0H10DRAFT_494361 [Mycena sp. CBHHK59/15]|nr:hypothetical protein B0H10DRAFT_494361 [Mycena sp. CBHHK59/15]